MSVKSQSIQNRPKKEIRFVASVDDLFKVWALIRKAQTPQELAQVFADNRNIGYGHMCKFLMWEYSPVTMSGMDAAQCALLVCKADDFESARKTMLDMLPENEHGEFEQQIELAKIVIGREEKHEAEAEKRKAALKAKNAANRAKKAAAAAK